MKFYLVMDERLTKSQRTAQAVHAAVEFMHEYG